MLYLGNTGLIKTAVSKLLTLEAKADIKTPK